MTEAVQVALIVVIALAIIQTWQIRLIKKRIRLTEANISALFKRIYDL